MSRDTGHEVLVTGAHTSTGRAIAVALAEDPTVRRVLCVHAPGRDMPTSTPRMQHFAVDLTRHREVRDSLLGEAARHVDVLLHVPVFDVPKVRPSGGPAASVATTQHLLLAAEDHPSLQRLVMLSSADVYRVDSSQPTLIDEDHPLELAADAPGLVRERVETDLLACARIGVSRLRIAVLRCAEIVVPDGSSQLHDYLSSRVCLRPLGYDPMLNVLALEDATKAASLAALSSVRGVFNIPGLDILPLSELIHEAGRIGVALPGPALAPLYGLRAIATGFRFRYLRERKRFHLGAVLNGHKAQDAFGYRPAHRVRLDALFGAGAATLV